MSASASATEAHYAHRRVLIAIDVSAASERALAYAERMLHANAFVHLVSIAENPRTLVPLGSHAMSFLHAARNELLKDAADCLSRAQRTMTRRTDIVVSTEVVDLSAHGGDIVDALTDRAQTWQADLAIVGTRQHHGVRRWIEERSRARLRLVSAARCSSCPKASCRMPTLCHAASCSRSMEVVRHSTRYASDCSSRRLAPNCVPYMSSTAPSRSATSYRSTRSNVH